MSMGFADGLRDLHDPRRVDSRLLEAMAELIGWNLKAYLTEEGQRNEIVFANEAYRTLGTKLNIAAMVNRLTGWTADVKEFARNVIVSWDSTRVERLEGGVPAYLDGSAVADGSPPALITRKVPAGSVDTADGNAMFGLRNRTFEDATAYTYDCGIPDPAGGYIRTDATWYDRETIGVFATPDVATEPFVLQQTWDRVRTILGEAPPDPGAGGAVHPSGPRHRGSLRRDDPGDRGRRDHRGAARSRGLRRSRRGRARQDPAVALVDHERARVPLGERGCAARGCPHRSVHTGVAPGP